MEDLHKEMGQIETKVWPNRLEMVNIYQPGTLTVTRDADRPVMETTVVV